MKCPECGVQHKMDCSHEDRTDRLAGAVERLRRERDEARSILRDSIDAAGRYLDERDAAREALREACRWCSNLLDAAETGALGRNPNDYEPEASEYATRIRGRYRRRRGLLADLRRRGGIDE